MFKVLVVILWNCYWVILVSNQVIDNVEKSPYTFASVESSVYSTKDSVYSIKTDVSVKNNISVKNSVYKIEKKEINPQIVKFNVEENYVNGKNLQSKTNYLIWVDKKNFNVNIFKSDGVQWRLEKKFPCSTGAPGTPTIEGTFEVGEKGYTFYPKTNPGIQCKYYTQISGNYLFHTVLMDLKGNVVDDRMKERISHGCVRLQVDSAIYIYQNIPRATKIVIN